MALYCCCQNRRPPVLLQFCDVEILVYSSRYLMPVGMFCTYQQYMTPSKKSMVNHREKLLLPDGNQIYATVPEIAEKFAKHSNRHQVTRTIHKNFYITKLQ